MLGMRIVVGDYVKGRARTALMSLIYLLGLVLFAFGSIVIFTLAKPTG